MNLKTQVSMWVLVLVVGVGYALSSERLADSLSPSYEKAAEFVLSLDGVADRGYCLVFGAGEGRLAQEMAKRSQYKLLGAEDDAKNVDRGRKALRKAGLYGSRVTLHRNDLSKLRYRDYAAVLVVSDSLVAEGKCKGSAAEMFRMVRPDGGMAVLGQPAGCVNVLERSHLEQWLKAGQVAYRIIESKEDGLWAVIERDPLPGAGEWTHVRGDIANKSCSGDTRTSDKYRVLWFGEPGPRRMVDRHWKSMPPLYKRGRVFTPARDRIICSDAYNGARLWDLELPRSSRIAVLRDAGWLALADEYLYASVEGACLKIDVKNGKATSFFRMPEGRQLGYVAVEGDRLYGSEQIRGGSYLAASTGWGRKGNKLARGDNRLVPTSTRLFCVDRHTGRQIWSYKPDNAVLANVTVCIGDEGIFFFETTSPGSVTSSNGRTPLAQFIQDQHEHLVKLDKKTGALIWRRQHELAVSHVLYLSYANGMLVSSGTTDGEGLFYKYQVWGFDAANGNQVWNRAFDRDAKRRRPGRDWSHGKQDKQPLLIGDSVYFTEAAYDLKTGRPREFSFVSYACSDYGASARHIFGRGPGGAAGFWSVAQGGSGTALSSAMRPGCGISIISGGGLVIMPSFGAGCMCDYTIQTSIGWQPVGPDRK